MRRKTLKQIATRLLLVIPLILAAGAVWAQQDFSADIVTHEQGKPASTPAKMYITKDKMRFESQGQGGHNAAVIINFAAQTSDVLMAERKMYMEFAAGQGPGAAKTWAYFRATDVENACGDWQKMVLNKNGGECHKVGSESVNGRSTIKYEAKSTNGDISDVWLDSKIAFPIKWQGKNSEGELQNIKEGSQPASLFEIPSDYQKMDMGAMMGRH
jgi:hypothetical protein